MASPSGRACDVDDEALPLADRVGDLAQRRLSRGRRRRGRVVGVASAGVRVGGSARALRLFLVQVAQDLLDAVLVADRLVEAELELRHAPQPQRVRRSGGGGTASRARAPSRSPARAFASPSVV